MKGIVPSSFHTFWERNAKLNKFQISWNQNIPLTKKNTSKQKKKKSEPLFFRHSTHYKNTGNGFCHLANTILGCFIVN